ncbi:MAG: hypothetical protein EHM60_12280 [Lysobacterales bacterium]|jgi:hypothetical protein|nr:MAG: hypothetical protein EHM60_12280 [Xanthomonadales bacterium]
MARIACLFALMALLAGCATPPERTPDERLELYRAAAGEPVRALSFAGRLRGWTPLGPDAVAVWIRRDRGYLLEVARPCHDLAFSVYLTLTSRQGRVVAGADSVIARRTSGGIGGARCRIETIRPLDPDALRESRRNLREGEVAEQPATEAP